MRIYNVKCVIYWFVETIKKATTPAQKRLENLQKQLKHADNVNCHRTDSNTPLRSTQDGNGKHQQSKRASNPRPSTVSTLHSLKAIVNTITPSRTSAVRSINRTTISVAETSRTPAQSRMQQLRRQLSDDSAKKSTKSERLSTDNNVALFTAKSPGQKRSADSSETKVSVQKRLKNVSDEQALRSESGMKSLFGTITNYAIKLFHSVATGDEQNAQQPTQTDADVEMAEEQSALAALDTNENLNDDDDMEWEPIDESTITNVRDYT